LRERRIDVQIKDEATLALWKYDAEENEVGKNVFLTHGTFSNKKICLGITEYLLSHGYTCWVLEWRCHGESAKMKDPGNFEKLGKEDLELGLRYLFDVVKIKKLDCVTHSGGGISLVINLITYPRNREKINSIVFFGCQSFAAGYKRRNYWNIYIAKYISQILGYIPAKMLGLPHNESYQFMKQWFDWNLSKSFIGEDERDFAKEMPVITIPVLSVCGYGDNFIAPVSACQMFLSKFKNDLNQLLPCGKLTGYSEDYNHSRLIYSRPAKKEIYPKVLEWLKETKLNVV